MSTPLQRLHNVPPPPSAPSAVAAAVTTNVRTYHVPPRRIRVRSTMAATHNPRPRYAQPPSALAVSPGATALADGTIGPPQFVGPAGACVKQPLHTIDEEVSGDDIEVDAFAHRPQLQFPLFDPAQRDVKCHDRPSDTAMPQVPDARSSRPHALPRPRPHGPSISADAASFAFHSLPSGMFQGLGFVSAVPPSPASRAHNPLMFGDAKARPPASLQVMPPSHEQRRVGQSTSLGVSQPWSRPAAWQSTASTRSLALRMILSSGLSAARTFSTAAAPSVGSPQASVAQSQPSAIRVDPTAVGARDEQPAMTEEEQRKRRDLLAPAHREHLSQMPKSSYYTTAEQYQKAADERRRAGIPDDEDAAFKMPGPVTGLEDDFLVFHDLTLRDIIQEKPKRDVLWIGEDQMIYEAIRAMDTSKVGALLVKDAAGKTITGIVTERDYMTKVALRGLNSRETKVEVIMTKDVMFGRGKMLSRKALQMMTDHRFRHLPVLDDDTTELLGFVSIGDLVKTILSETAETALYYRDFAEGNYRYSASQGQAYAAKAAQKGNA